VKIDGIKFEQVEGDASPSEVTVTMSIKEAIWMAKVSGLQRGESPHNGIYQSLVCDVMNRYWEDGVDGAMRMHHVEIPPIRYEEKQ